MKSVLIIFGFYAGMYAVILGTGLGVTYAVDKTSEKITKIIRKKSEKNDLKTKAEAYGWDIVECEYTIEAY